MMENADIAFAFAALAVVTLAALVLSVRSEYPMCRFCKHMRNVDGEMRCAKFHAVKCRWVGGTKACVFEPDSIGKESR